MIAEIPINDFPNIQSGRFQIIELIGSGGAGKVYKAIDTTLSKTVAIKLLHSNNSQDAVRFQREAKLAGVLKHPNVVQVYDFGFTSKEELYLVLEYVEGQTLAEKLESGASIPLPVALKILTQIAAGLFHAHSKGVVHRDIKPGNIILVDGEEPLGVRALIVDFGLAKQQQQNSSQSLTATGIGLGTPRYMSPEQFRGGDVDYRSDIYSFGCLMFETLTGAPPFQADNFMQLSEQHMSIEPPSLSDTIRIRTKKQFESSKHAGSGQLELSDALEAIVRKCLQKSPADRYQSAEQLRLALMDEFQKELTRSNDTELPVDEELDSQNSNSKQHNRSTSNIVRVCVAIGAIICCSVAVGLWMSPRGNPDRGVKDIPLKTRGEDVQMLKGATKLPISGVYLSKTGVTSLYSENDEQLKENLKGLNAKRIDLSHATFTPQGFRDAETSEAIQVNYFGDKLERDHIKAFSELKHLRKLGLGNAEQKLNTDDLSLLSSCTELRQLAIKKQTLTTHDFENISKLTRLEDLDLSECKGVTADKLVYLKKLTNLTTLLLDNTGATDKEIDVVASMDLTYLGLKKCDKLTEKSFDKLGRMKHLQRLNIKGTDYPMSYILTFRRHNPDVMPDREQLVKTKVFDYTEFPFGK